MSAQQLPAVFAFLADNPDTAVEAALLQALPSLESHALTGAIDLLIARGQDAALFDLVSRFRQLGTDAQALVIARVGDLFPAVRTAIDSDQLESRLSAILLIERACAGKLAYLLADALRSKCAKTRGHATQALHKMANDWCAAKDSSVDGAQHDRTYADDLGQAIAYGVKYWEAHLQPAILEAAAWMNDRVTSAIAEKLEARASAIGRPLDNLLVGARDPRLAGFVLRSLAIEGLRASAVRAVSGAQDPSFIRGILQDAWLLADPQVRKSCRWIRAAGWLHPDTTDLEAMAAQYPVALVEFASAMGLSEEARTDLFRALLDIDDQATSHAIAWKLVDLTSDASHGLLSLIAERRIAGVSEIAKRELRRRHGGLVDTAEAFTTVDHSESDSTHRRFEAAFRNLDELNDDQRARLLELLKADGERVLSLLRSKLASPRGSIRKNALKMAHALQLIPRLAEPLYRMAHDTENTVRSLAVGLLAHLPGSVSLRILRAAVHDPDARVQANAIEALDLLECADRTAVTAPKLDSPHSRVRANAVKSLLRTELRTAGDTLLDMLDHSARSHRLSALWVIERLNLRSMLDRLGDMCAKDPDPRVRQRANRIVSQLGGAVHILSDRPNPPASRTVAPSRSNS